MKYYFLILFTLCLLPYKSIAQDFGQNDEPIEISADNDLQWIQDAKQYIANGNVEVIQGENTIYADQLIADYKEENGKTKIWQIVATKNVRLNNADSQATAQKAVYNFDTGAAILTGNNLKLTSKDQVITATQSLTYNMNDGTAEAKGNAMIKRPQDSLRADVIKAKFSEINGQQRLKTAQANGNVIIQTAQEKITGDNGQYDAVKNTAQINGNIVITRGPNKLEGAKAIVDLTSNVSKIYGAPEKNKRVKGVFFPTSRKDLE